MIGTGGPAYYGAPQQQGVVPAKKSKDNGCLIWGLAGCGILLLLGVIGVIYAASQAARGGGGFGSVIKNSISAQVCGQDMEAVNNAIQSYRDEHNGKYPAKIVDLVPYYLADTATETCGGTVKQLGDKLVYHAPKPKAPDESVVVEVFIGESAVMGQKTLSYVRILKSNTVVVDQVTRAPISHRRSRFSSE